MSTVRAAQRFTVAEYLTREERALTKSEYFQGEIVAMAGTTIVHNIITGNVFSHLHALLRDRDCRPFGSDQRIKVEGASSFVYADVVVVCGDVVTAKDDPHSVTNPRVVVEVLSESTESKDRGKKLKLYLKMDSLCEYILISQEEPRTDKLLRKADGTWAMSIVEGLKDWLEIPSIDCRLAMTQIYDGVKFEPLATPAD